AGAGAYHYAHRRRGASAVPTAGGRRLGGILPTGASPGRAASARPLPISRALHVGNRADAVDLGPRRRVGAKPWLVAAGAACAPHGSAPVAAGLGAGRGGAGDLRPPVALRYLAWTGAGACPGSLPSAARPPPGGTGHRARSCSLAG